MNKSELRALCDALPGKSWEGDGQGYIWARSVGGCRMEKAKHMVLQVRGFGHFQYRDDCDEIMARIEEFAVAARTAIPELLDELDAQAKEIGRLREALKELVAAEDAFVGTGTTCVNLDDLVSDAVEKARALLAESDDS